MNLLASCEKIFRRIILKVCPSEQIDCAFDCLRSQKSPSLVMNRNLELISYSSNYVTKAHMTMATMTIDGILIIGAGPHSLCLVSKLLETAEENLEETPYNTQLFNLKQQHNTPLKHVVCKHVKYPPAKLSMSKTRYREALKATKVNESKHKEALKHITVVDDCARHRGKWLSQWEKQFNALQIQHLRSGINAHPDPLDQQSLRWFAEQKRKVNELVEIDLEKVHHYEGPFEVPSTQFFNEFCADIVARYHIDDKVVCGHIKQIRVISGSVLEVVAETNRDNASKLCGETETTTSSSHPSNHERSTATAANSETVTIRPKAVVVAAGSLTVPRIPFWLQAFREQFPYAPPNTVLHSCDILKQPGLTDTLRPQSKVIIVGGGLTSGHLAVRACKAGHHVTLLCREQLKLKQFDLDLEWMSSHRNRNMATFWSKSFADRVTMLRQVKGGGSITPEVMNVLDHYQEQGLFEVVENTEVIDLQLTNSEHPLNVTLDDGSEVSVDSLWAAVGVVLDASKHPLLSDVMATNPIDTVQGLPVLTEDLQWDESLPLFVMGEMAALHLGPGAVNLMGGRAGSVRVARRLRQLYPWFNKIATHHKCHHCH